MRDTSAHRKGVILWEWLDARGRSGALSGERLDQTQQAKLDEKLDRIRELPSVDRATREGYIFPFRKNLKKLKIRGRVQLRPILVTGPFAEDHEVTFLLLAREENRVLVPPEREAEKTARQRLKDVLDDPFRRKKL